MFAQINHMAMVSPIYPMLAKFYEAYFGLKPSGKTSRPLNAVTVGDGYVGLNINPQRDGYVGGLDHFGMVVEDLDKCDGARALEIPHAPPSSSVLRPGLSRNTARTIPTAMCSTWRRRRRATSWWASTPNRPRAAGRAILTTEQVRHPDPACR